MAALRTLAELRESGQPATPAQQATIARYGSWGAVPEVFDQRDEDGIVVLLQENPPEELHARAKEAAQLCPALAIEVDG